MNRYIGMIMYNFEKFESEYLIIKADDLQEADEKLEEYVNEKGEFAEAWEVQDLSLIEEI